MKLRITHTTAFAYDAVVSECYTEVRLRPADGGGQHCLSFQFSTDPRADVRERVDRYGNEVRRFDILPPHDRLVVTARSEVLTPETYADGERSLSPLSRFDYLAPSAYAPLSETIRAFAAPALGPGDPRQTVDRLADSIHGRLKYEKGATDVTTNAEQALAKGRGVCQDYAHLMLAACRLLGLPARYVSGYVYTPGGDMGAASHAWADVFLEGRGWVAVDPTNDAPQAEHHVRVAVGRDYADVPPTRGVYKGSARETLAVDVRIEEA
jgi:transglutaminase-like putative cysteine protease